MSSPEPTIRVDVHILLRQDAGINLEFRKRIRSPDIVANLIAGFAHAMGGTIVVGYDQKKQRIVGCNRQRIQAILRQAEERLGHSGIAKLEFHSVDGRDIGLIEVTPVAELSQIFGCSNSHISP